MAAGGEMDCELDRDLLENVFGNEANYNVVSTEEDVVTGADGCAQFPDGTHWAICTNWANYVRRALGGRVALFGYMGDDNPTSEIGSLAGGHDFAVVDDRFIVDGWVRNVECMEQRAVFDLQDPADAFLIERLYGDRGCWERQHSSESLRDAESPHERSRNMQGTMLMVEMSRPFTPGP
jgi:hypothetical protein